MTATATLLRLPDFELPAIPDGYKLAMIELTRLKASGSERYHRLYSDNYPNESAMVNAALLYVIKMIGWYNARIEFVLERDDGADGRMVYDCKTDVWESMLAE